MNRLQHETSPHLREHADDAVDWHWNLFANLGGSWWLRPLKERFRADAVLYELAPYIDPDGWLLEDQLNFAG